MPDAKREQVLSVRDLDITFKTTAGPVHAIRGVNIDLYKGETVALVGESGSGKSVTMKAAMGILAQNAKVDPPPHQRQADRHGLSGPHDQP